LTLAGLALLFGWLLLLIFQINTSLIIIVLLVQLILLIVIRVEIWAIRLSSTGKIVDGIG
jgi:hypothetical protein